MLAVLRESIRELRKLFRDFQRLLLAVIGVFAIVAALVATFGYWGLVVPGALVAVAVVLAVTEARGTRRSEYVAAIPSAELVPSPSADPPTAPTADQHVRSSDPPKGQPLAPLEERGGVSSFGNAMDAPRIPERELAPVAEREPYTVEDWHEIFRVDRRNHSRHTYIIRLKIKAHTESLPELRWYTHYTGSGPQTNPKTAGPPAVEGAEFAGYVPAEEMAPGWTGWRLRFGRPLHEGEEIDVSIVQELHDKDGTFEPVFGVDAPVRAKRLVLELDLPPTKFPTRIHGYCAGAHPAERVVRPIEFDKVLGKVVMTVLSPIPGRDYWLEWSDPSTGARRANKTAGRSADGKRSDHAFTLATPWRR